MGEGEIQVEGGSFVMDVDGRLMLRSSEMLSDEVCDVLSSHSTSWNRWVRHGEIVAF